jgi:hypothetical protein
MMFDRRKAQEEIIGFILIIVLVTVVFIVFLGISLRSDSGNLDLESREVYQFLESMMEHTSDCAINYEPAYSELSELLRDCHSNSALKCTNGEKACEVLEESISGLLGNSWEVGEDRSVKGYSFKSEYRTNSTQEEILEIESGDCSGSLKGSEYIGSAYPGSITSSLDLCF